MKKDKTRTPWEAVLERRKANIGFVTRTDAFENPTDGMKAQALAIETKKWQETIGKKPFHLGNEYSVPKGHGINLLRTREPGGKLDGPEYDMAIGAYITTPMDHYDILKAQGIDVSRYENPPNIFHKIYDWIKCKFEDNYERGPRLTKEFLENFSVKEKK